MEQAQVSDVVYDREGNEWKVIERSLSNTEPVESVELDPETRKLVKVYRHHQFTVLKIAKA